MKDGEPILIDKDELTVVLLEAIFGVKRPEGATIEEALEHVDAKVLLHYRRGAIALLLYIAEKCDLDLSAVSTPAAGVM